MAYLLHLKLSDIRFRNNIRNLTNLVGSLLNILLYIVILRDVLVRPLES